MTNSNLRAHPMLIIAGIAVTIFALVGTAAVLGWIPKGQTEEAAAQAKLAQTKADDQAKLDAKEKADIDVKAERAALEAKEKAHRVKVASAEPVRATHSCPNCGTIESVNLVETAGQSTPLGMIAGGVVGGLLGNQVGQGNGRTVATVAGAAGGAYAGNEIEKHVRKTKSYKIVVRLNDGESRVFHQNTDPGFNIGDRVKIENNAIVRL